MTELITNAGVTRFVDAITEQCEHWVKNDLNKIRNESQDSLIKFAEHFLSHHFTIGFCSFHTELLNDLSGDNANKRLVRIAPRGHGKTALCALAYPLWSICTGRKRHILIIGSNQGLADQKLNDIITEIEGNVLLRNTYPVLKIAKDAKNQYVKYTDSHIVFEDGSDIMAKGMGAAIRGVKPRRDMVIIDDPEKDSDVDSPRTRDKNKRYFDSVVRFLGGPGQSMDILAIDTLKHFDSLIQYISNKPGWDAKKYSAVVDTETKEVLWPEVYCYNTELMEPDEISNWEKRGLDGHREIRQPFYGVIYENDKPKIVGLAEDKNEAISFDQEFLGIPMVLESMPLRKDLWITFPWTDAMATKFPQRIGALDLSMGKQKGDFQAIAVLGAMHDDYYLLDAGLTKLDLVKTADGDESLASLCVHYIDAYKLSTFVIEDNGAQGLFVNSLIRMLKQRKVFCRVRGYRSTGDKVERISNGLGLVMQRGSFYIRSDWQKIYPDFMRQFEHFPKADHDDAPDVTNMALMGIQRLRG